MDRLLTVSEVADVCQVHPKTVTRAIARGELRASRLGAGRAFRIRPADIDARLDDRVTEPQQTTHISPAPPRRRSGSVQGWLVA